MKKKKSNFEEKIPIFEEEKRFRFFYSLLPQDTRGFLVRNFSQFGSTVWPAIAIIYELEKLYYIDDNSI